MEKKNYFVEALEPYGRVRLTRDNVTYEEAKKVKDAYTQQSGNHSVFISEDYFYYNHLGELVHS